MIRQLGPPTFFLTLSAAEIQWPELMKIVLSLRFGRIATNADFEKHDLVRNDPVTCARFFHNKMQRMMAYLKFTNGAFDVH